MAVKTYSSSSTGSSRARKTQFIKMVRIITTSKPKNSVKFLRFEGILPGLMIALIAALRTGLNGENK